jgi:tetratricopeptide (TPR) repeat protein
MNNGRQIGERMKNAKTFLSASVQKIILVLAVIALVTTSRSAENYVGANALLRAVEESTAKTNAPDKKTNAVAMLRADLKAFREAMPTLSSADAAKRWLGLLDRSAETDRRAVAGRAAATQPIRVDELLEALPPPAAWIELARAITARPAAKGANDLREVGLKLLAATLTDDPGGRKQQIAVIQAKAEKADAQAVYFYRQILDQVSEAMLSMADDPDAVLKSLERRLKSGGDGDQTELDVPNLIALVGRQKAEAFLRRALVQPEVVLEFESPNETSRLAQSLALELIAELKTAQWVLVNSLDAVALYEALDKRFGKNKAGETLAADPSDIPIIPQMPGYGNFKAQGAKIYYMLGLISQQRAKEAVAVAKQIGKQGDVYFPYEALKPMERAGHTAALDSFFFEVLSQDPGLPFWNEYVELAAKAGQTERMVALARTAAANEELSQSKKTIIHETLFKALLAADQVEEGVKEMRRLFEVNEARASTRHESPAQLGIVLARLGILTGKPEWIEEGIGVTKTWLTNSAAQPGNSWGTKSVPTALAEILFELKRGPEAEAILSEALTTAVRPAAPRNPYSYTSIGRRDGAGVSYLIDLARLYDKAGRHGDVLALLEQAPYWGKKDLAELSESRSGGNEFALMQLHIASEPAPLSYIVANALAATGRKTEALKINTALLDEEPGLDRGYELLLQIDPEKAAVKLDELFARDRFEERPLIWKAVLLRQQGKLEEAEKLARQAISIDPSDGEQGSGDRMRAYAELAEIREARGDKREADLFRGAVRAIRLSEEADKYYQAGLLKRAIKMYEDSLKHFADAYCIQSRLAIQLAALGQHEAAEEHYRRAYELMPDSFGRVESHCFGCERAFDGERAQNLAEKVFTKLAVERPDKPQVHYLLGYLREEQERYNEAKTNFQTAVKLDSDYLNAWVKIQALGEHVQMPAKERDAVVFAILRLDPLRRHGSYCNYSQVTDLAGLWNAVAVASKLQPPRPTELYPLTASKSALEKNEKPAADYPAEVYEEMMWRAQRNELTPGAAIGQTAFVRLAAELFGPNSNSLMEE